MQIKQIEFIGSFPSYTKTPHDNLPNFAFIGRSNVGKSSLINMLSDRKAIAKVSNTPGKTQLINYFKVNESWHLVDLPGYGYAKISKKMRAEFRKMIENYLVNKNSLVCTFVLLDCRHSLQEIDREFINWCGANRIPIALIFTKLDKLKPTERAKRVKRLKNDLLESWEYLPDLFLSSSETREGQKEILGFIDQVLSSLPTE